MHTLLIILNGNQSNTHAHTQSHSPPSWIAFHFRPQLTFSQFTSSSTFLKWNHYRHQWRRIPAAQMHIYLHASAKSFLISPDSPWVTSLTKGCSLCHGNSLLHLRAVLHSVYMMWSRSFPPSLPPFDRLLALNHSSHFNLFFPLFFLSLVYLLADEAMKTTTCLLENQNILCRSGIGGKRRKGKGKKKGVTQIRYVGSCRRLWYLGHGSPKQPVCLVSQQINCQLYTTCPPTRARAHTHTHPYTHRDTSKVWGRKRLRIEHPESIATSPSLSSCFCQRCFASGLQHHKEFYPLVMVSSVCTPHLFFLI